MIQENTAPLDFRKPSLAARIQNYLTPLFARLQDSIAGSPLEVETESTAKLGELYTGSLDEVLAAIVKNELARRARQGEKQGGFPKIPLAERDEISGLLTERSVLEKVHVVLVMFSERVGELEVGKAVELMIELLRKFDCGDSDEDM